MASETVYSCDICHVVVGNPTVFRDPHPRRFDLHFCGALCASIWFGKFVDEISGVKV